MAAVCETLCREEGLSVDQIKSVGIATPGTADTDSGIVIYANNLPFRNFPIAEKLKVSALVLKVIAFVIVVVSVSLLFIFGK